MRRVRRGIYRWMMEVSEWMMEVRQESGVSGVSGGVSGVSGVSGRVE